MPKLKSPIERRIEWIVANDERLGGDWGLFFVETGISPDTRHSWRYHNGPGKKSLERIRAALGYRLGWLRQGIEPMRDRWAEGRRAIVAAIAQDWTDAQDFARLSPERAAELQPMRLMPPADALRIIGELTKNEHSSAELPGDNTPRDAIASTTHHGGVMIWRAFDDPDLRKIRVERSRVADAG